MPSATDRPKTTDIAFPTIVPKTLALPRRRVRAGDELYRAGREASSIYIVGDGVLKAVVPTSLGRERIADLLGPGEVLGVAALDGGHHAETVQAIRDSCLIPLDPIQAFQDRRLRGYILGSLAKQLRRSRELLDDAQLPVGARVTRALLRLLRRFGVTAEPETGGAVTLPLSLTHEELASLAGSSRVTITRILGELRSEGVLTGNRGLYCAVPAGLEAATDNYVMQVL